MSSTCKRFWPRHNGSSATRSAASLGSSAYGPGKSFPLGATLVRGGANFSVFAKHSTGAQLLLFDDAEAPKPSRIINLDPRTNRTYHYWHIFVPSVTAGQIYAYRVAGPVDAARGSRFDPDKVLLDPFAGCSGQRVWKQRRRRSSRGAPRGQSSASDVFTQLAKAEK